MKIFLSSFRVFVTLMSVAALLPALKAELSKLTCSVSFLKSNDINEELLSSVEPVPDLNECSQIIALAMAGLYTKLGLKGDNKNFEECFKRGVESSGLKGAFLLSEALKQFDIGWRLWKISARDKRVGELTSVLSLGLRTLQDKCNDAVMKEKFRNDFDKVVYKKDSYPGDLEFCMRKHLVESGILDPHAYNMNINPQQVNENDADCSYIIASIQNPSYAALQRSTQKCIHDFYRQNHFVEYYMKAEFVLPHLNLTPQEASVERENFTEKLFSIKESSVKHCNP